MDSKIVKVGIVGSGLAGLTAAYHLSKQTNQNGVKFDVHLFEKTSNLGMDFSSISLSISGSKEWRVDVPMRSFQGGYYPQLIAFYNALGVAFRRADFSYSFSLISQGANLLSRRITTTMIYNGRSGLAGVSMPSKMNELYSSCKPYGFLIRYTVRVWTLILFALFTMQLTLCYLRLLFLSLPYQRPSDIQTMRFQDWAVRTTPTGLLARWTSFNSTWTEFTQLILLPLFSAICTAPEEDILNYPVEEFLDYVWMTLGTHHYVVLHGVRDVVSRLTRSLAPEAIHLSSAVLSVERDEDDPRLASLRCSDGDGEVVHRGFHHIILAAEAKSSMSILQSFAETLPSNSPERVFVDQQVQCLAKFKYVSTTVINHTDDSLLPDNAGDRRDLNLISVDRTMLIAMSEKHHVKPTRKLSPSYTMATHILPRPVGIPEQCPAVYQTTNPIVEPSDSLILSVARLERAVVTLESKKALSCLYDGSGARWAWTRSKGRLGKLQGRPHNDVAGIWICGSFAYPGIPLLEGCVVTARTIVEHGIMDREGIES